MVIGGGSLTTEEALARNGDVSQGGGEFWGFFGHMKQGPLDEDKA
jgi:hypothetical protein